MNFASESRRIEDGDRHTVRLEGCRPTPLASYLKALAVLRLVAEQVDPEARGWWEGDTFVLESVLDADGLLVFVLQEYRPTPIVAPWNGGSGFFADKDNTTAIDAIASGRAERFDPLRAAIAVAQRLLRELELSAKPDKGEKLLLLEHLRAELDDGALEWMDAAVLLLEEDPKYPPLLGTGGNDGRLEFSNNFMQRLVDLFDPLSGESSPEAAGLLAGSLFGSAVLNLGASAIGQFSPGAAGGPNASTAFEGDAVVNGFDYIFLLEGAMLFAAAATRRLESTQDRELSYPFTVHPVGAGSGSLHPADSRDARGEMWLPLWRRPMRLIELKALLGEGRATVGRRNARDGLDFARAVARLGVARGIDAFQRYGFLQRYGRTYLAMPLNRVAVRANPTAELIDELERFDWLPRFRRYARRKDAPARLSALARRLDDTLFALAIQPAASVFSVQQVLIVLGEVMRYLATSPQGRERCGPVPLLTGEWAVRADDATREFRIAAALAGIHARRGKDDDDEVRVRLALPMITHVAPVDERRRYMWNEDLSHRVVWSGGAFEANLKRALERRLLDAESGDAYRLPLDSTLQASGAVVADWLARDLDCDRTQRLFLGLCLVRIPGRRHYRPIEIERRTPLPAVYAMLKPLFCPRWQLEAVGVLHADTASCPVATIELVRLLGSGNVDRGIEVARLLLRSVGIMLPAHVAPGHVDGSRLLAGLMVPIPVPDLRMLTGSLRSRASQIDSPN